MSAPRAPSRRRAAFAAGVALAGVVAGCSHTVTVGADRTVHLAISEYRINPDDVRVGAGVLTIYVRNFGRLTHNLVISRNGVTAGATEPLFPGASAALTVTLTPGMYQMASTITSDGDLGIYGTLDVTG